MRRVAYYPFLLLIATLFLFLTLPSSFTGKIRRSAIGLASPVWSLLHKSQKKSADALQLSLENQRLHEVLEEVFEWVLAEENIQDQVEALGSLAEKAKEKTERQDFFIRRKNELQARVDLQLQSIPAKIIFRDPLSCNHFVWINVGEKENEALGRTIIAVDSPVVVGDSLVGVVEEVERSRSKVRLITDSGLGISVRTVRGSSQESMLYRMIAALVPIFKEKENLFAIEQEKETFLHMLSQVQEKFLQEKKEWFLAKGVLQGTNLPLWPFSSQKLEGHGFNYDCADSEGERCDLKRGSVSGKEDATPLIATGDLLITSGMDGIFPSGLSVAIVTHVSPLKEAAYAYDLEALPVVANLSDLSVVFVMPPLFEKE